MQGRGLRLFQTSVILAVLLLVGAILSVEGQASKSTHTGKDFVAINKITPCIGADIPTPCKFPYSMELTYTLATADKGKLRVGVFLRQPGSKAPHALKTKMGSLQPLLPYIEKNIVKGTNTVKLDTGVVGIPQIKGRNAQLMVVVNVQNSAKKELCWATSYNFLRGSMSISSSGKAVRDSIQLMSYAPNLEVGPLYTGKAQSFNVQLQYSVNSAAWAFANLELCDRADRTETGVWHKVAVPLPKGAGTVKVNTRDFFLPVLLSGREMMLDIPFRVKPLGSTVNYLRIGPWILQRPRK